MPLHPRALGRSTGSVTVEIDHRWVMAYASGVPDERPELFATDTGLTVHPLFPVAPEWSLVVAQRSGDTGLTLDEARRGIHVGHDLRLDGPLPAEGRVEVEGRIVSVGARRAGATYEVLFTATDLDSGRRLWRTRFTSLFLGVALDGDPASIDLDWPALPAAAGGGAPIASVRSEVRTIDAHVYSECARIWNPIHTDVVAARRSGLPSPILHGTATLARSVSIATGLADVPLASVSGVGGHFRSPVALGSWFDVRLLAVGDGVLHFDAVNPDGSTVLDAGVISLGW